MCSCGVRRLPRTPYGCSHRTPQAVRKTQRSVKHPIAIEAVPPFNRWLAASKKSTTPNSSTVTAKQNTKTIATAQRRWRWCYCSSSKTKHHLQQWWPVFGYKMRQTLNATCSPHMFISSFCYGACAGWVWVNLSIARFWLKDTLFNCFRGAGWCLCVGNLPWTVSGGFLKWTRYNPQEVLFV